MGGVYFLVFYIIMTIVIIVHRLSGDVGMRPNQVLSMSGSYLITKTFYLV